MPVDLSALAAERKTILTDAGRIIDRCKVAGRNMAPDERAEFERLHDMASGIQARMATAAPAARPCRPRPAAHD